MVEQIIGSSGSEVKVESDEFRIIEATLTRAMSETEELRSLLMGHERSLELYRFRAALRGAASEADGEAIEYLRFSEAVEFAVAVLDPLDPDDVGFVEASARRAIHAPLTVVDVLRLESGICVVLGSARAITSDDLRAAVTDTHARVQSGRERRVAAAVSHPHPIAYSARAAVEEALLALEYRIVDGTASLLEPQGTSVLRDAFEFTLQEENELANRILAGDFPGAKEVTEDILQRNFEQRALSIEMGRCLAFSLATMFVRSLTRVARFREGRITGELRPIERIASCRTYEELRTTIVDLLQTVCIDIADGRASHTQVLMSHVEEFIAEQLTDPNLGTKIIADRFDMNPAYLSRVFKEHQGSSFSDYINRQRITLSKKLLRDTDRTIADIGSEIGYTESSSFIRFFKKFEGVTPGVFRDEAAPE
jgi:AraC-like DNA-binding protein